LPSDAIRQLDFSNLEPEVRQAFGINNKMVKKLHEERLQREAKELAKRQREADQDVEGVEELFGRLQFEEEEKRPELESNPHQQHEVEQYMMGGGVEQYEQFEDCINILETETEHYSSERHT